jgi:hypothetical protein
LHSVSGFDAQLKKVFIPKVAEDGETMLFHREPPLTHQQLEQLFLGTCLSSALRRGNDFRFTLKDVV